MIFFARQSRIFKAYRFSSLHFLLSHFFSAGFGVARLSGVKQKQYSAHVHAHSPSSRLLFYPFSPFVVFDCYCFDSNSCHGVKWRDCARSENYLHGLKCNTAYVWLNQKLLEIKNIRGRLRYTETNHERLFFLPVTKAKVNLNLHQTIILLNKPRATWMHITSSKPRFSAPA